MSHFILREINAGEDFDITTLTDHAPFTQAHFYGEWQRKLGRTVKRFVVENEGKPYVYFQLITYPLLFGKKYAYLPYGPVVKEYSNELLAFLKKELWVIAKKEHVVFMRLDFTPHVDEAAVSGIFKKAPRSTYHSSYFQPRAEWFLGLEKSEEELLAGMHKNTRYSVQLATKREVTVEVVANNFVAYLESFLALMRETASRNGFSLHPDAYYRNIFENLNNSYAYLTVARHGEKILTVDLIVVYGKTAHYVFSGTSTEERERAPSYGALWEAIRHAKQLGCDHFNFGGVSSENAAHTGWGGLTSFKKKFGGEEVKHSDFYDVVINPFWYVLYVIRKQLKS